MAHNVSNRKARSQALELVLGVFTESESVLEVSCGACRVVRSLSMAALVVRHGDELPVRLLLHRLKCRECGGVASTIKLKRNSAGSVGVVLKGPGSY